MGDLQTASSSQLSEQNNINVYGVNGEVIAGLSKDVVEPYIANAKDKLRGYEPPEFMENPPTLEEEHTTRVLQDIASALGSVGNNGSGRVLRFESYDDRTIEATIYAGNDSVAQVMSRYTFDLDDKNVSVYLKQEAYDGETGLPMVDYFKDEHFLSEPLSNDGTVSSGTFIKVLNEISIKTGVAPSEFGSPLQTKQELRVSLPNITTNFDSALEAMDGQPLMLTPSADNDQNDGIDLNSNNID